MNNINAELSQRLESVLAAGMPDDAIKKFQKKMRDLAGEFADEMRYYVRDELAPDLVSFVEDMARRTVEAILQGNQGEMVRYLGCDRGYWTGRSDSPTVMREREQHEWHPVIHGRLFEQGAVKLRRDIANAHADLIKDQRVLDLEDQVASLVAQVNKADQEKNEMWERVRHIA